MPTDADYDSVTVDILSTFPKDCTPPGWQEFIKTSDLRVNIPRATVSGSLTASQEGNNIARIDSVGAVYVPGVKRVVVQSAVVSLGTTDAPGTRVTVTIPVPGISDPQNAIKEIQYFLDPASAAVNMTGITVSGSNLVMGFTRVNYGQTAPYEAVTISVQGAVYELPQSESL